MHKHALCVAVAGAGSDSSSAKVITAVVAVLVSVGAHKSIAGAQEALGGQFGDGRNAVGGRVPRAASQRAAAVEAANDVVARRLLVGIRCGA